MEYEQYMTKNRNEIFFLKKRENILFLALRVKSIQTEHMNQCNWHWHLSNHSANGFVLAHLKILNKKVT